MRAEISHSSSLAVVFDGSGPGATIRNQCPPFWLCLGARLAGAQPAVELGVQVRHELDRAQWADGAAVTTWRLDLLRGSTPAIATMVATLRIAGTSVKSQVGPGQGAWAAQRAGRLTEPAQENSLATCGRCRVGGRASSRPACRARTRCPGTRSATTQRGPAGPGPWRLGRDAMRNC